MVDVTRKGPTMPLYDCGDEECAECQRAFGPDRRGAIENRQRREAFYAQMDPVNAAKQKLPITDAAIRNAVAPFLDPVRVLGRDNTGAPTVHIEVFAAEIEALRALIA